MKRAGAEAIEGGPELYPEKLAADLPGDGCRSKALMRWPPALTQPSLCRGCCRVRSRSAIG
jgi:hypothetical protein